MAREEVLGVPFGILGEMVQIALREHEERTEDDIQFDLEKAALLEKPPEGKSYSARGSTALWLRGERAGELVTVVFAPGEGSGDEGSYSLAEFNTGEYPHKSAIVPRRKTATAAEVALSIGTVDVDSSNSPVVQATNLDLLTHNGDEIVLYGQLGDELRSYQRIMAGREHAKPTATLTVGSMDDSDRTSRHFRFVDPHAVYNHHPDRIQVVSFVAVTDQSRKSRDLIKALTPVFPR